MTPFRATLLVAAVAAVTAVAILLASAGGARPIASDLRIERGMNDDDSEQYIDLLDDDGNKLATAVVETVGEVAVGTHLLRTNISHGPDTILRSARWEFHVDDPEVLALRPPGGFPWPPYEFFRSADRTVVDIADLGPQGQGSLTLEFLLGPLAEPPESVEVLVNLSLERKGPLSLTRHLGSAEMTIVLSEGE